MALVHLLTGLAVGLIVFAFIDIALSITNPRYVGAFFSGRDVPRPNKDVHK